MAWKNLTSSDPRKPLAKERLLAAAGVSSGRVTNVKINDTEVRGDVLVKNPGVRGPGSWSARGTFTAQLYDQAVVAGPITVEDSVVTREILARDGFHFLAEGEGGYSFNNMGGPKVYLSVELLRLLLKAVKEELDYVDVTQDVLRGAKLLRGDRRKKGGR